MAHTLIHPHFLAELISLQNQFGIFGPFGPRKEFVFQFGTQQVIN